MDKHTNSGSLPKQPNHNECKNNFQNFNVTDGAELNQYSYNSFFTFFERLSFEVQIEKEWTLFTVTNLNAVHIGVFAHQANTYYWVTSTANSKLRCKEDQDNIFEKESWPLIIQEISLN